MKRNKLAALAEERTEERVTLSQREESKRHTSENTIHVVEAKHPVGNTCDLQESDSRDSSSRPDYNTESISLIVHTTNSNPAGASTHE